jgi:hypothetical protein
MISKKGEKVSIYIKMLWETDYQWQGRLPLSAAQIIKMA